MNGQVDLFESAQHTLREVFLAADADGIVGKFTSNLDRIALALSAGRKQCVVPYVSLDVAWCSDYGIARNVSRHFRALPGGGFECGNCHMLC